MNTKRIIQVVLLTFVAVSVVYFVVDESRKSAAGASQGAPASPAATPARAKVVAYYFHGNYRCVSCRKLESVSHLAVINGFPEELKRGDVQWATINVEQRGNEHFVSDYGLSWRSLVIVRFRNGRQVEYKNLIKAWELLRNDEALRRYVQSEVQAYLQES